jgi:hypothetical protein
MVPTDKPRRGDERLKVGGTEHAKKGRGEY